MISFWKHGTFRYLGLVSYAVMSALAAGGATVVVPHPSSDGTAYAYLYDRVLSGAYVGEGVDVGKLSAFSSQLPDK